MSDVALQKVRRLISDASVPPSGTTAERPTVTLIGFIYFDTDLGKPVWWTGTKWVDAAGADA
jgi:hypothetical protein